MRRVFHNDTRHRGLSWYRRDTPVSFEVCTRPVFGLHRAHQRSLQYIRKRGVLCPAYEAELTLDVSGDGGVKSDEEGSPEGLDVGAGREVRGDGGYGRKKHPSVWGRPVGGLAAMSAIWVT